MKIVSLVKAFLSGPPGGSTLAVGVPAPEFDAPTHKGERVKLSELRGQRVLLWFYPKADTPGCTAEGCGFRDLGAELAAKGVKVLGVSFDSVSENRAFAEKFRFEFPLLCDESRAIGMAYGACDRKTAGYARRISYLIDGEGRIERAWDPVSARSHPAQVLAALNERA